MRCKTFTLLSYYRIDEQSILGGAIAPCAHNFGPEIFRLGEVREAKITNLPDKPRRSGPPPERLIGEAGYRGSKMAVARSNVAVEMFRAMTCTVLFDQTVTSTSLNHVNDTSDACAKSPARARFTVTSSCAVAALLLQPLDDAKGAVQRREAAARGGRLLARLVYRAPDRAAVHLRSRVSGLRDPQRVPRRAEPPHQIAMRLCRLGV